MSHPLAAKLRKDNRAGLLRAPTALAAPRPTTLRAEGDDSSCSCTGTAVTAGLIGAIVGGLAGLAVSDAKKAEAKAAAKRRAAGVADRAAARLRA